MLLPSTQKKGNVRNFNHMPFWERRFVELAGCNVDDVLAENHAKGLLHRVFMEVLLKQVEAGHMNPSISHGRALCQIAQ